MRKTQLKKLLSLLVCTVLIAALALGMTGCKDNKTTTASTTTVTFAEGDVLGEGARSFTFTVEAEGKKTACTVKTDKTLVGEALQELNLIEGEEGEYGLFVKYVTGIYADYDVTKTYWAFYIDGAYGLTGVDVTEIVDGAAYAFKVEK